MPIPGALYYSDGIKGSNTVKGREDSSEVIAFDHDIRIPVDQHRGTISGKRQHNAAVITKEQDTATPLLQKALCEGDTLDELRVEWYRINDQGIEELYFTHTLKNVKVTQMETDLPNVKDPEKERLTHLEKVSLVYEQIEWKHEDGYEYMDNWQEST